MSNSSGDHGAEEQNGRKPAVEITAMVDMSNSSGNHGGEEEKARRPAAGIISMAAMPNSSGNHGTGEEDARRPVVESTSTAGMSNSSGNHGEGEANARSTAAEIASIAGISNSSGNHCAGEENARTPEMESTSMADISNSSGDHEAGEETGSTSMVGMSNSSGNHGAEEKNARRPAAEIPPPPPPPPPTSLPSASPLRTNPGAAVVSAAPNPPSGVFQLPPSPCLPPPAAAYPPPHGLLQFPAAYAAHPPPHWLQPPPFDPANPPPPPFGLLGHSPFDAASNHNSAFETYHDPEMERVCSMMTSREQSQDFTAMLEQCDEERLQILTTLVASYTPVFLGLARDQEGSSRLRMLLGRSRHVDQMIFTAVTHCFFALMIDQYGRYLAMRTLAWVDRHALYQLTESHALALARDRIGCASLNDVITDVRGQYRDRILSLVVSDALSLSEDPYGAHVIQHVLRLHNPWFTQGIAIRLGGHYVRLSRQRLGSHVVERVLESQSWTLVVEELLTTSGAQELPSLANDRFGNYVVQSALRVSHANDRGLLGQLLSILRGGFYGSNIVRLIEQLDSDDRASSD